MLDASASLSPSHRVSKSSWWSSGVDPAPGEHPSGGGEDEAGGALHHQHVELVAVVGGPVVDQHHGGGVTDRDGVGVEVGDGGGSFGHGGSLAHGRQAARMGTERSEASTEASRGEQRGDRRPAGQIRHGAWERLDRVTHWPGAATGTVESVTQRVGAGTAMACEVR